jgi:hypothetical protein
MNKTIDTDSFSVWPFRSQPRRDEDGEINNGGIDLIKNPERIDEIHEATIENGMHAVLAYLNGEVGRFMTLGCAAGMDGPAYYSYLELTLRDKQLAMLESWPFSFEAKWKSWVEREGQENPLLAQALKNSVVLEYRAFSFRDGEPQYLVTIYSKALDELDHQKLYAWVLLFFQEYREGT